MLPLLLIQIRIKLETSYNYHELNYYEENIMKFSFLAKL